MVKTAEQMILELYTVMLGVPNSDEKGMKGDVKEIKDQLKALNGAVKTNTTWRRALCWAMGLSLPAIGVTVTHIFFG